MIPAQSPVFRRVSSVHAVNRARAFVEYIVRRCESDNGVRAALGRSDNPSTEYQSWEILAGFGIDLESESERLSYGMVAADIARTKSAGNGAIGLGYAIGRCYKDGSRDDQAKSKLRRLLACDSVHEAVLILRPIFRLIESRGAGPLDYASILIGLQGFDSDERRNRSKVHWAQEFFGKTKDEGGGT